MNKKLISTLILITLLIAAGSGIASAADRSYSIPFINMDLFLQEDGSLHVKETIHYTFSGTYNGIYRDIPLSGTQELQNVKVSTQGAYSRFVETNDSNYHRVTVYLYSDSQMTSPVTDKEVDVVLEYDMTHVVKFYNDIAELQYKLVGEGWAVDIGKVNANIHLKSSDGVKYWLNPPYYNESSSWQGNTLQIASKTVPNGNFYEVRMVIPKNQFAANPTNGIIINQDGLSQIEQVQNDYQSELTFKEILYSILTVLMLFACLIPFIIYYRFGREPKIDYSAEYERDTPTDDPPAVVNAICGPGFSKKIGEPDMDGFKATIMDLINRNYLIFSKGESDKEDLGLRENMSFKLNPEMDNTKLRDFEKDVINFLKGYEENGLISLDYISEDLKDKSSAKSFRDTYNSWKDNIKEHYLNDEVLKKIFNKKGDNYLKIFGVLAVILAIAVFYFTLSDPLPAASWAWWSSIILGIVALISFIMPQKIAGQWTTYGEEYDAKWHNFKRYIQDFSLIKEYPPESVAIWNKYLVYATALGVADKVRKAMELYLPRDELEGSNIYLFHYYGGYVFLSSTLNAGMTTANAGNGAGAGGFGGVGGVGGGFGGGGGGAF
ncbi:MAG: DUF2207 domain-containing protein [Methanobacterium sp.]|nr:DUF2207 domain-containing protein [Methanobacterium sp.]